MSAPEPTTSDADAPPAKAGKKKKLILIGGVLLLVLLAGLWFSGVGPKLLGAKKPSPPPGKAAAVDHVEPIFAEIPDVIANLNAPPHHPSFIKLKIKIELARAADQPVLAAAMPRVLDLFQTYLRDLRPEELRGSAGTYRLREELIARANIAVAPAHVTDVLFVEMLIQ